MDSLTTQLLDLGDNDLKNYMAGSWPIFPKKAIKLVEDFLNLKKSYGTNIEKGIYKKHSVMSFLNRLIKKRPLVFMGRGDYWMLKNGQNGTGGWDLIGSSGENQINRKMKNYLTYNEIEISSFLSFSIYTPFINTGSRRNLGLPDNNHEKNGIYIVQCGARFEERSKMEWLYMVIDPGQNTRENGYGLNNNSLNSEYLKIWANFYQIDYFPTYDEVNSVINTNRQQKRFIKIPAFRDMYFDTLVYKKRLKFNIEVFLKEANARAYVAGKNAFCHVVGLGLGAWGLFPEQEDLTIESYIEVITEDLVSYKNISDIYFSWFSKSTIELPEELHGIKLHRGTREPAEKLNDNTKLLVANSAGDPNSLIGNEWYENNLAGSGDPASASCSFIGYLGNSDINKFKKIYLV